MDYQVIVIVLSKNCCILYIVRILPFILLNQLAILKFSVMYICRPKYYVSMAQTVLIISMFLSIIESGIHITLSIYQNFKNVYVMRIIDRNITLTFIRRFVIVELVAENIKKNLRLKFCPVSRAYKRHVM